MFLDWVTGVYFGNEGDRRALFAFGSGLQSIEGTPYEYQLGERVPIEFRAYRDVVEFRVAGKTVARARRIAPIRPALELPAGDPASPGECVFSDFEIGPPPRDEMLGSAG